MIIVLMSRWILRDSDLDIGQIAEAVGYQNSSYFYKLFKKQTGMSPGDYRKAGVLSS
ncbi:helix-turn-helix domain-containing protein [Lactiplantibacillus plantarum]